MRHRLNKIISTVVTYELFFRPVYICLFVWQEVIERYFILTECNKIDNKKRKNWDFCEIIVENKKCGSHHRLKKYFKEQLCTFLESKEYSPYNMNQKYVLTYVRLLIIQREYETFCCTHTNSFKDDLFRNLLATKSNLQEKSPGSVLYKKFVLKSFLIFTEKHLCWSLFFDKVPVP